MTRGAGTVELPERLFIFGCGGSGREIAWLARQTLGPGVELVFIVDDRQFLSEPVHGIPVLLLTDVTASDADSYVVALGDSTARRRVANRLDQYGMRPFTLVHPRSEISSSVAVSPGTILCAGVVATVDVEIGAHAHINVHSSLSHDVKVGDFATLSPGVHVAGHVVIGQDVFLGIGASVINGSTDQPLTIGAGAVVAAGACVTESVEAGTLVAGVPATRKRRLPAPNDVSA